MSFNGKSGTNKFSDSILLLYEKAIYKILYFLYLKMKVHIYEIKGYHTHLFLRKSHNFFQ